MGYRSRNRHLDNRSRFGVFLLGCLLAFVSHAVAEPISEVPWDESAPKLLELPRLDPEIPAAKEQAPTPETASPAEEDSGVIVEESEALAEPEYRSIALTAEHSPISTPITENVWVMDRVELSTPPIPKPIPQSLEPPVGFEYATFECYSDADSCSPGWSEPLKYTPFPEGLLWQPPLANQREPRMFGKFTNHNDESTIETAIGAQFGLFRFGPQSRPFEGIQLDTFAAVFTRFNANRLLVTSDFRVGLPLTYSKGPWQTKFGYEHTSTHLGDEYIQATGRVQVPHVRDEFVAGLAYRFMEIFRVYGQAGYSFITSDIVGEDRDRYNLGIEWMRDCPTDWRGRPFAAVDLDLRSDQDYTGNLTVQVGWYWRTPFRRSGRILLEYYTGKSPYGQFFQDNEDWIGIGGAYDW